MPRMALAIGLMAVVVAVIAGPMRSAGASHSPPVLDGHRPVAFLVEGSFGSANIAALDATGRTLAFGTEDGDVLEFALCPGGRRVAEIIGSGTAETTRRFDLVIREQRTLRLVRRQRLPRYVGSVQCADATGEHLVVFSSGNDPDKPDGRLMQITRRSARTIWRGTAWYASLGQHVAYLQVLDVTGTTVLSVNTRTGSARKLGTVRLYGAHQLVLNPSGTRLVGDAYDEARVCCDQLVVIDLTRHPISLRTIVPPTDFGDVAWFGDNRFGYFANGAMFVYSARLRLLKRVAGWRARSQAVVGSTVFGVRLNGMLIAAKLPFGPVRVVRQLPGSAYRIVSTAR